MSHVGFAVHEYEANYVYSEHGRQPYFAIGRLIDAYDGATTDHQLTLADGTTWSVTLDYNPSGLKPAPDDPIPDGQPMHEYWLKARPIEETNRAKATFNISPRWNGQQTMQGEELSTPFQHDRVELDDGRTIEMPDEGLNVDARCSNLNPFRIPDLFQELLHELARDAGEYFDFSYFEQYHETSNVRAIEGYVRHTRASQSALVETDGVLMQIMHLLADQEGVDATYHVNNEQIQGHMHRVKLSDKTAGDLVPDHHYGKQFKSYHPRDVFDDPSHPLYHPKFGVLIKSAWNQDTLYVDTLPDILQEIEEAGTNVLSWAGLTTSPDGGPWISDDHFTPDEGKYHVDRHPNPLPEIEVSQESHLLRVITQGTNADLDIMQELVADGGQAHHEVIENASGYSSSTLYRMLQRIPELVESENGIISFRSEKLYQDMKDILDRTSRAMEYASSAVANLLGVEAEALEGAEGELTRFIQKYAADITQPSDDRILVKINAIATEIASLERAGYTHIARIAQELERLLHTTHRYDSLADVEIQYTEAFNNTMRTIDIARAQHRA